MDHWPTQRPLLADVEEMSTLAEKQAELIADLRLIPDPQERLMVILDMASKTAPLTESERADTNLVRGCVSRVWLVAEKRGSSCHFKSDAEAPTVRGLVALLCQLYDGAEIKEIVNTEPEFWEALGMTRTLSPTRLNGLAAVRSRIRELAHAECSL
jgi:cysteine desulfuration protein SufE